MFDVSICPPNAWIYGGGAQWCLINHSDQFKKQERAIMNFIAPSIVLATSFSKINPKQRLKAEDASSKMVTAVADSLRNWH